MVLAVVLVVVVVLIGVVVEVVLVVMLVVVMSRLPRLRLQFRKDFHMASRFDTLLRDSNVSHA